MKKIDTYDFSGKKAIVRVDFNVPLNDKFEITDDTRIRAAIPTLKKVLAGGGSLIIMSHLGRPKGPAEKFSLKHILPRVSECLGVPVQFAPDCQTADAQAAAAGEKPEAARKIDAAKAKELYTRAFDSIQALADAGNLRAQKLLGDFYFDGLGNVTRDYTKALEIYTKAGEAGDAASQARVGYIYQNALGVPADYSKAMEWNNRAAQQGNPQGQEQIGYLYHEGLGVTKSLDEASRWYAKAKDGGSDWAAAMLDETDISWAYGGHGAHA